MQPVIDLLYEDLCRHFTLDELLDAIFSFKNGKSPGPDGLTIEFYKYAFSIIKHDLLSMFNSFLDKEMIPTKMKKRLDYFNS